MKELWRDRQFLLALSVPPLLLMLVRLWAGGAPLAWPLSQAGRFLGLVLWLPVMEEVIFRGALQPILTALLRGGERGLAGVTRGNGCTSLIFAAAHLFAHSPFWSLLVFFPSVLFGYFRDRHDSLLPPLFLHIAYNLSYYWYWGA